LPGMWKRSGCLGACAVYSHHGQEKLIAAIGLDTVP
jgi:hypothetical protein